jgi:hypothetical protein
MDIIKKLSFIIHDSDRTDVQYCYFSNTKTKNADSYCNCSDFLWTLWSFDKKLLKSVIEKNKKNFRHRFRAPPAKYEICSLIWNGKNL